MTERTLGDAIWDALAASGWLRKQAGDEAERAIYVRRLTQADVLEYVTDHPGMTTTQIALALGSSQGSILKHLTRLRTQGALCAAREGTQGPLWVWTVNRG